MHPALWISLTFVLTAAALITGAALSALVNWRPSSSPPPAGRPRRGSG